MKEQYWIIATGANMEKRFKHIAGVIQLNTGLIFASLELIATRYWKSHEDHIIPLQDFIWS
jgi:hypothetical protein